MFNLTRLFIGARRKGITASESFQCRGLKYLQTPEVPFAQEAIAYLHEHGLCEDVGTSDTECPCCNGVPFVRVHSSGGEEGERLSARPSGLGPRQRVAGVSMRPMYGWI